MTSSMKSAGMSSAHGARPFQSRVRRVSGLTASRQDLVSGPVIVAPPEHLSKPSNADETAMAMEIAKHHLAESSGSGSATPTISTGVTTPEDGEPRFTDTYAFAFDIDGVLIKGGEVIPEAIEAMKVLNGQNDYNIKV
jgi:hypothetical protein